MDAMHQREWMDVGDPKQVPMMQAFRIFYMKYFFWGDWGMFCKGIEGFYSIGTTRIIS